MQTKSIREQLSLFSNDTFFPESLPTRDELQPAHHLAAIFDACHNYIYANEGLLKDKIFHEMVKLLIIKLHDEQLTNMPLRFGITSTEYKAITANHPSPFINRLHTLFAEIKPQYQAFFTDTVLKLQPLTLAYIVNRLQNISLSNTPGDIKGEAFQIFVNRHQRGDRGEFFTPHPIVRLAVEMIAPQPHEKIIDPACGSGGFLIQAANYIRENFSVTESEYIRQNIAGIEFNPDVALSAMLRLIFEGGSGSEILCANALLTNPAHHNAFDIVLTNPPFGNKGKVEDANILAPYLLARKWKHTRDHWQIATSIVAGQAPDILFIEKSLNLLRPGGRMAIVLPDGILQNISNGYVRYWLRTHAKILAVVSIPQEAFVPYGTGIKTSLLLIQKLPSKHSTCFMAQIHKIGYDVKGQPVYKRTFTGEIERTVAGQPIIEEDITEIAKAYTQFTHGKFQPTNHTTYTIPEEHLNSRLDAQHYLPQDQKLLHHLKSIGAKPLNQIAEIVTQTDNFRTNDDEIRYIAISDVDYRTMQVVSQQSIQSHAAPSRATYRLRIGDIITATSGASTGTPRQATALITADEDGAICSNGFAVIRNIHGVEPLFLLAYLRTEPYLRQVKRLMTGHAIPAISNDDLAKILVPIPPQDQQIQIAQQIAYIQTLRKQALTASEQIIQHTNQLLNPHS